MADTSTAIVFNYLDRPDLHVPADVVSTNHFNEDGLIGIYALLEPEAAASRRDLLIDVAQAGDFGVFRSRRAARIAFAVRRLQTRRRRRLPRIPGDSRAAPRASAPASSNVRARRCVRPATPAPLHRSCGTSSPPDESFEGLVVVHHRLRQRIQPRHGLLRPGEPH